MLGGVTVGAYGIADNPSRKRHPTIGNRVQIGAFTGIFGAISIGDDVFIGAQCVITENIPSFSSVTARPSKQVVKYREISSMITR
jgi:serine O-acetyltransferase